MGESKVLGIVEKDENSDNEYHSVIVYFPTTHSSCSQRFDDVELHEPQVFTPYIGSKNISRLRKKNYDHKAVKFDQYDIVRFIHPFQTDEEFEFVKRPSREPEMVRISPIGKAYVFKTLKGREVSVGYKTVHESFVELVRKCS